MIAVLVCVGGHIQVYTISMYTLQSFDSSLDEVKMLETALEHLKVSRQGALEATCQALAETSAALEAKRLAASRAQEAVAAQRQALLEAKVKLAEVTKQVIKSRSEAKLVEV